MRSEEYPRGLPYVAERYVKELHLGTQFMLFTVAIATRLTAAKGLWSIENPLHSIIWVDEAMIELTELMQGVV